MSEPVLSLRAVAKSYGAAHALDRVDVELHRHEVLAVIGDSGAGKSTLVGVMSGNQRPDAGEIVVDGRAVTLTSPAVARSHGIASVFQDLALAPNLDVVENLFLGAELTRGRLLDEVSMEKQAWELLGQLAVRVPSVRVPVGALSAAQRQGVAIARSLLGDPKVIVLDEPTASLGIRQTAEFLTLVERLRSRGLGVVVTSHSLVDVHAVADRILVLRLGRVNGEFDASVATQEELLAAVTGVEAHGPGAARGGGAR